MKHAQKRIDPSVKVFFTEEEMREYEDHLAPFAGKKGAYLKQLLMRDIQQAKAIRLNRTQIDYTALAGNSSSGAPNTAPVNTISQIDGGSK